MRYYLKFKKLFHEVSSYRVSLYAANTSFYIILAFFPTIMLLVALLPMLGFSQDDLIGAMHGIVPEILMPLIERIVNDMSSNSSFALVSVTALITIWSSSRGVYFIQVGINAIHGKSENRSYLYRRILSMCYMLLLFVALILTIVILGFGQELAYILERQSVPILKFIADIMQFRGLIVLLLLSLFFCAMYCVFPNQKVPFKKALPGAVLAALGWLIFTLCFSIYARYFSNYSVLYGSLSIIAFGMLWLYVCISILFYGCVFNLFLDKNNN
ncbi:MAG: YihY/virulence factor BrkB family protein [Ruminococcaceae bacterium]|nr:YihY/virulence factor BrkB family protein [Oscillospiraceae bacterium]